MQFEITFEDDLLHKVTAHGLRVHSIVEDALRTAVDAAEAAQELGEGVEPIEAEKTAQEAAEPPYATARSWYTGDSLYQIMNEIRRTNRRVFGRRARLTIYPDGQISANSREISGSFIVEVRYPKNSLFQPKKA